MDGEEEEEDIQREQQKKKTLRVVVWVLVGKLELDCILWYGFLSPVEGPRLMNWEWKLDQETAGGGRGGDPESVSNEKQQSWVATWNGFLEATEEDDKRAIEKKEEEGGERSGDCVENKNKKQKQRWVIGEGDHRRVWSTTKLLYWALF